MSDPRNERDERPGLGPGSPVGPSPSLAADTLAGRISPSDNDGVTMARMICSVCGRAFRPAGRRRFCSDACRQAAWRRRHSSPGTSAAEAGRLPSLPPSPEAAPRPARSATVYECPSCGTRYLGEQRCPDCRQFCRRVGPGGRCPHCDEPVAISDLIADGGR